METSQRVLGAKHPHVLTSMGNLACTLMSRGRDIEAIGLVEEILERASPGPDYNKVARILDELHMRPGDDRM
jgi:hypothetical protein